MLHALHRACPVFTPPAIDTVVLKGIEQSDGSFVFRSRRLTPIDNQLVSAKPVQDGDASISAGEAREKALFAMNGNEQRLEETIVSCLHLYIGCILTRLIDGDVLSTAFSRYHSRA